MADLQSAALGHLATAPRVRILMALRGSVKGPLRPRVPRRRKLRHAGNWGGSRAGRPLFSGCREAARRAKSSAANARPPKYPRPIAPALGTLLAPVTSAPRPKFAAAVHRRNRRGTAQRFPVSRVAAAGFARRAVARAKSPALGGVRRSIGLGSRPSGSADNRAGSCESRPSPPMDRHIVPRSSEAPPFAERFHFVRSSSPASSSLFRRRGCRPIDPFL